MVSNTSRTLRARAIGPESRLAVPQRLLPRQTLEDVVNYGEGISNRTGAWRAQFGRRIVTTRGEVQLDHGCYPGLHALWLDGQILAHAAGQVALLSQQRRPVW